MISTSMTTLLDFRTTLAYLAYLGYDGNTTKALKITKARKHDRRRVKVQRTVFLSYVFGATGSGKVRSSIFGLCSVNWFW
jgi:mitochondrial Rho GTPase 1